MRRYATGKLWLLLLAATLVLPSCSADVPGTAVASLKAKVPRVLVTSEPLDDDDLVDDVLTGEIKVANLSDMPVRLRQVSVSCNCLSVKKTFGVLPPWQSDVVRIEVKADRPEGFANATLTFSDDLPRQHAKVSWTLAEKPQFGVRVVEIGDLRPGQSFDLRLPFRTGGKVGGFSFFPVIEADLGTIERFAFADGTVSATLIAGGSAGSHQASVRAETNDRSFADAIPIRFSIRPTVYLKSDSVALVRETSSQSTVPLRLTVAHDAGSNVIVKEVRIAADGRSVAWTMKRREADESPEPRFDVEINFPVTSDADVFREFVEVVCEADSAEHVLRADVSVATLGS